MQKIFCAIFVAFSIVGVGCTQAILKDDTLRHTGTVPEIIANQTLYNLVLAQEYFDRKQFNAMPAFVHFKTGQIQVAQSVSGQFAVKAPPYIGIEQDPQISGQTQTTENWGVEPVTDPVEVKRLRNLYRILFEPVSVADFEKMFPPSEPEKDKDGKPFLDYVPISATSKADHPEPAEPGKPVLMIANQPQFMAKAPATKRLSRSSIPGAMGVDSVRSGPPWFSIGKRPSCIQKPLLAGIYRGKEVWIMDPDAFYRFELLTLGDDNPDVGAPKRLNSNGLQMLYFPQTLINPS